MTYSELVQLTQDYLQNDEASFVANIPQFVQQAEARIYNQVRTIDQRKTVTDTVNGGTITPPEDFIEPLYLSVGGNLLRQREKSFLKAVYGDTPGTPESYALDYTTEYSGASTILIGPPTAAETAYELAYAGQPYSIVDQEVTYLSQNFPECLLNFTLLEGYIYMKATGGDGSLMKMFEERANQALVALQRSAEGLQLKDEYRNVPEKVGAPS